MVDVLLLRLESPLMSFGAAIVDEHGRTQDFPALSMLSGLIANALGYEHRDAERIQTLQSRLRWAARQDRPGRKVTDFHTVDLGQPSLVGTGWTTWGAPEGRAGGSASTGTHIRYREYLADAAYTVAISLSPSDPQPNLDGIEGALRWPARPLFIGRKCCLPASPILVERTRARSLLEALRRRPIHHRDPSADASKLVEAWWPADETGEEHGSRLIPVTDARDWRNQIHGGRRLVRHGRIRVGEAANAE